MSWTTSIERARHDSIVRAVKQMVGLHEALASAKTSRQKTTTQRQIATTEIRIDQLVFELYGLSEAEIALVENAQTKEENANNVAPIEQAVLMLEE